MNTEFCSSVISAWKEYVESHPLSEKWKDLVWKEYCTTHYFPCMFKTKIDYRDSIEEPIRLISEAICHLNSTLNVNTYVIADKGNKHVFLEVRVKQKDDNFKNSTKEDIYSGLMAFLKPSIL